MTRLTTLSAIVIVFVAAHAAADERSVTAPISSVTLYPDRASVTRTAAIDLVPGEHTLTLDALPANLIAGSIRAQIDGADLRSLDHRTIFPKDVGSGGTQALKKRLSALQEQRTAVLDQRLAFEGQLRFFDRLGQAVSNQIAQSDGPIDPDAWQDRAQALWQAEHRTRGEISALNRDLAVIDDEIERLTLTLDRQQSNRTAVNELALMVGLDEAKPVSIALQYQVAGAGWQPNYEARLNSDTSMVELIRTASIRQQTGEDWQDVTMTLSTTDPGLTVGPPQPGSLDVDIFDPVSLPAARHLIEPLGEQSVPELKVMAEPGILRRGSDFQTLYRIGAKIDLPADGRARSITLQKDAHPAALRIVTVPRLDAAAYRVASITPQETEALPGGLMKLFVDNGFVGEHHLRVDGSDDMIDIPFGLESGVAVTRKLESGQRSSSGIINKNRVIERSYMMSVTNNVNRSLDIEVQEQLPVARDDRIVVELIDRTTDGFETNTGGIEGLLSWRDMVQPGETRLIRIGYRVSYPADLQITGLDFPDRW